MKHFSTKLVLLLIVFYFNFWQFYTILHCLLFALQSGYFGNLIFKAFDTGEQVDRPSSFEDILTLDEEGTGHEWRQLGKHTCAHRWFPYFFCWKKHLGSFVFRTLTKTYVSKSGERQDYSAWISIAILVVLITVPIIKSIYKISVEITKFIR